MERVAREAKIKLMVNYWNVWSAATQDAYARIQAGELGPVQKLIVAYGHKGPKEIGTSKYFSAWLYDPMKNGAGSPDGGLCHLAEAQDRTAQRRRG